MTFNIKHLAVIVIAATTVFSCSNDDDRPTGPTGINFTGTYAQEDQMGRPAVNTVFVSSSSKDQFNITPPSMQGSAFQSMFQTNLMAVSPAYNNDTDANALTLTAAQFSGLLATDVLNVSLDGTTTFFDGTNVLTGRALADDVITVELTLIFGGEDGLTNPEFPGLVDDNVDANDKPFLTAFPYLATPW